MPIIRHAQEVFQGTSVYDFVAQALSAPAKNPLNQYTGISLGEATASPLQYDTNGNVTSVQTSTGTWGITYNGENRPVRFVNAETQTVVDCAYDSQGRRFEKKVTVAGATTLHHRQMLPTLKS